MWILCQYLISNWSLSVSTSFNSKSDIFLIVNHLMLIKLTIIKRSMLLRDLFNAINDQCWTSIEDHENFKPALPSTDGFFRSGKTGSLYSSIYPRGTFHLLYYTYHSGSCSTCRFAGKENTTYISVMKVQGDQEKNQEKNKQRNHDMFFLFYILS